MNRMCVCCRQGDLGGVGWGREKFLGLTQDCEKILIPKKEAVLYYVKGDR